MTFAVLVSSIYLVSQETECSTLLTFIPRHDLTNELQKILECLQVNGLQSSCPYLQWDAEFLERKYVADKICIHKMSRSDNQNCKVGCEKKQKNGHANKWYEKYVQF